MPAKKGQNLAETDRGSNYNLKGWLEEFLDDKCAFYSGSESGDSDNMMRIIMKIMNSSSFLSGLSIFATK